MPAIRKLSDEEIRYARYVVDKRREAQRLADEFPTLDELAEELHVTPRYLRDILNGRARVSDGSTGNILTAEVCS
jgi:hypothetical protein